MIKRFSQIIITLALVLGVGVMVPAHAGAVNLVKNACDKASSDSEICKASKDQAGTLVQNIIGILLWAVGLISVIMIVVGGIRYAISGGDASQIKSARETIIYAVAGLVVALLAYAIVRFVLGYFK